MISFSLLYAMPIVSLMRDERVEIIISDLRLKEVFGWGKTDNLRLARRRLIMEFI